MKMLLKTFAVAAVAAGLSAGSAFAVPTLFITDNTNIAAPIWVIVDDGSGLDIDHLANGFVSWSGAVGVWDVSVIGSTKPVVGSVTDLEMDLHFSAESTLGSRLTLGFLESGFSVTDGIVRDHFSGTSADGSILNSFVVKNQTDIPTTHQWILGTHPLGPGHFSTTYHSSHDVLVSMTPQDNLTIAFELTHGSEGGLTIGNSDITISAPDGGMTAMLLTLGLLGVGLVARRFKSPTV